MAYPLNTLTFPLHGNRLIEASAGTGKTYTIAALYLRLVLGHGGENGFVRPLTPPEILVVTFTNAATEELRDRIRCRLTEAAAFFRRQGSGDEYLLSLREAFPEPQWPAKARQLEQAAQWMDESAIFTIHSWCQRMLRQHAFDSGSLFDLELETNEQPLLEEAACDYWRKYFYPLPAALLGELLESIHCDTPQALLDQVRPLLNLPLPSPEDPFDILARRQAAIETARLCWQNDFDAAVAKLRDAQARKILSGVKYRAASLANWIDQLSVWVKGEGPLPKADVLGKLSQKGLREGINKNKTAPEHPAFSAFDRLIDQLAELVMDEALLVHAAWDIGCRFRQAKHRQAQMGFDDLLSMLQKALQAPGGQQLAAIIRTQFPVVLIDEFQDTDPVQYDIFSNVYLEQPDTGLLMIGDPKQAIYAFRGADIHTYLRARKDTGTRHYTLEKNYRSTNALIDAVNQIFSFADPHAQGAFLFNDQIPFHPVKAQGGKGQSIVDGEPLNGLHIWQLPQTGPVKKTGEDGYIEQMARSAASEIVRLLNLSQQQPPRAGFEPPDGGALQPLRPADIAILVRNQNEARAIRRALDARHVRSVYLSDKDSVFACDEATSLLYWLRACAEPEQERLLRAALATPVLNLPLTRLEQFNRDELAWEAEVERFRRYQRVWQRQGILPMLRMLLGDFDVAARLLSLTDGERAITNLLHLAEMLQTAAADLDGEHALIRWLAEQIEQPGSGAEEQILRLESDDDLVRVITVHKSKGLEYPLVFLPFICSFQDPTRRILSVARYHDDQGRLVTALNPGPDAIEAIDNERLAEDVRLLYVAVTRARFACWLGVGVVGKVTQKDGEQTKLHQTGLGYLLSAGQMILTGEFPQRLQALKGDSNAITLSPLPGATDAVYRFEDKSPQLDPALGFGGNVSRDWRISSYSSMLAGAQMKARAPLEPAVAPPSPVGDGAPSAPESAAEEQLQEAAAEAATARGAMGADPSIHGFPRGPDPGTFLHGVLEWAADQGFANLVQDSRRCEEQLAVYCQRRDWGKWAPVMQKWLKHLLQTPLLLPDGQGTVAMSALAGDGYQAELEFMLAAHRVDTRFLDQTIACDVFSGAMRPELNRDRLNGMVKGFIDLVFCHQDRYYVLDYKSNYLGENQQAYSAEAMATAMLEHRYDLQYVLYTLALHRLLKARLPDYSYRHHMGGVLYLFLRGVGTDGQGVFSDKPSQALIETLDEHFAGKETLHAHG
ncbi:RecBCD enzyme subunit RecB [Desulfosarcina ovata subsp. sediminis]|uniref:DNA 3'-5' helicase n=1 Tax=Desulfosarcina ovata subsp. sediminis TaxID=885957 RepID=A0A5K7ZJK8_9BACT|nr:exodeoxyribonuclease V subunit beta [Desulfosarcina ovata]BBO80405.1 RecBCD enzyme subunit RecB [Desulfosarcina ovata subsp. sediminis]